MFEKCWLAVQNPGSYKAYFVEGKIMKTLILAFCLSLSLSAQANLFDLADITKTLVAVAQIVNTNLEKVRLVQNQNLDIREQWDLACETTQNLNQGIVALNKMLAKYKVNQETCAPITAVLNLQVEIVKNCQNFYSKPVPDNAQILLNKFSATLLQSRLVLVKCYPSLRDVKISGLP